MKPAAFEYVRADTIAEALTALDHDDAKIIAGGQSLVPMMNFRLVQPERLVDVNGIIELARIDETDTHLRIGALVRHAEAAASDRARSHFPIIGEAMQHVAHLAIRNRGTIAGSLVHADPSAEWPLLVTLLDGEIEILGPDGSRTVAAEAFFVAPLVVEIDETEMITGVTLPKIGPGHTGMAFDEIAQRAGDFAIVACGVVLTLTDGLISDARIALGGVADTPVRARAAEQALIGQTPTAEMFDAAAEAARDGLEPNSDLHASADYRLHLVRTLTRRMLKKALERAKEQAE